MGKRAVSVSELPTAINWVAHNRVSPIADQGYCNSCYAFSATAAIESALAIKHHRHPNPLSKQEIIDCDRSSLPQWSFHDEGCVGGSAHIAMNWVHTQGGLETQHAYPSSNVTLHLGHAGTCRMNASKAGHVVGAHRLASSVHAMMHWVATKGPITVLVNAGSQTWQHYKSGIIRGACGPKQNHFVTIVGYKTVDGIPVWIIRNSWGAHWGMDGYAYLERSARNVCNVNVEPVAPLV